MKGLVIALYVNNKEQSRLGVAEDNPTQHEALGRNGDGIATFSQEVICAFCMLVCLKLSRYPYVDTALLFLTWYLRLPHSDYVCSARGEGRKCYGTFLFCSVMHFFKRD